MEEGAQFKGPRRALGLTHQELSAQALLECVGEGQELGCGAAPTSVQAAVTRPTNKYRCGICGGRLMLVVP